MVYNDGTFLQELILRRFIQEMFHHRKINDKFTNSFWNFQTYMYNYYTHTQFMRTHKRTRIMNPSQHRMRNTG